MELWEPDLIYAVKRHYLKADGRFVAEDARRVRFLRRARQCAGKHTDEYQDYRVNTSVHVINEVI